MKKKTFFVLGLAALAMFSCNKATEYQWVSANYLNIMRV